MLPSNGLAKEASDRLFDSFIRSKPDALFSMTLKSVKGEKRNKIYEQRPFVSGLRCASLERAIKVTVSVPRQQNDSNETKD